MQLKNIDHINLTVANFEDRFALRERGLHGLNHFGLRITDQVAWEETIVQEKLTVLYDGPITWPHNTSWYVTDPTGYEIEVAMWQDDTISFNAATE